MRALCVLVAALLGLCLLSLLPHGAAPNVAEIERAADDLLLPLRGITMRSATRPFEPIAGLSLEGDGLRFLACKPSEDGKWTVLRCVNIASSRASGSWQCGWPIGEAYRSRLDERVGDALPVRDGRRVDIEVDRGAVATILVR